MYGNRDAIIVIITANTTWIKKTRWIIKPVLPARWQEKAFLIKEEGPIPFPLLVSSALLPTKFSLSSSSVSSSFFSFPVHVVYLVLSFYSSQAPTRSNSLTVCHALDPQSLSLTAYLASCFLSAEFSKARAPLSEVFTLLPARNTPNTNTNLIASGITQRGFNIAMGWLMNLLLLLGWSPETSVCGGSSLQGREDTQFGIEYSAPKRKVTHWA